MSARVTGLQPAGSGPPDAGSPPRLAGGVTLLGPYQDSGLEDPPYLVRRADRILQLSRLLYVVAAAADGTRSCDEIATVAAAELGRSLTADEIRYLVRSRLAPAGILSVGADDAVTTPAALVQPAEDTRLFALRYRRAVVSPETMDTGARYLGSLFRPAVVAAVVAGVVGFDVWLFGRHGVTGALDQMIQVPAVMMVVLALVCLSGAFHELGHAAGCRYSGGRPGAAGVGLYLWWPVLYTNVTDAYRLDRRGRLRTDLGGIYFNAVFTLVVAGAYATSGFEPLLAVVVLEHGLVFQQFVPWVRLDGYYIVSDLTGVPDILSRVKPALLSLLPGRPSHPAVAALRPRARRILFAYLGSLVVFLALGVVPAVRLLPRTLAVSWASIGPQLRAILAAAGQWDVVMVVVRAVAVSVLALPLVGLALTAGLVAVRVGRGTAGLARRARTGPVRRPDPPAARHWLESSGIAFVEGAELPGGGAVDWFGFGPGGDLVLVGAARDRTGPEAAARLLAAAEELGSFSSDKLDRLLLDGPPFAEAVARAARRARQDWDEGRFRSELDRTLARRDFALVVLTGRPAEQIVTKLRNHRE